LETLVGNIEMTATRMVMTNLERSRPRPPNVPGPFLFEARSDWTVGTAPSVPAQRRRHRKFPALLQSGRVVRRSGSASRSGRLNSNSRKRAH